MKGRKELYIMVKMKKTAELKDANINIAEEADTIIRKKNTKSMKKSTKKKVRAEALHLVA